MPHIYAFFKRENSFKKIKSTRTNKTKKCLNITNMKRLYYLFFMIIAWVFQILLGILYLIFFL